MIIFDLLPSCQQGFPGCSMTDRGVPLSTVNASYPQRNPQTFGGWGRAQLQSETRMLLLGVFVFLFAYYYFLLLLLLFGCWLFFFWGSFSENPALVNPHVRFFPRRTSCAWLWDRSQANSPTEAVQSADTRIPLARCIPGITVKPSGMARNRSGLI